MPGRHHRAHAGPHDAGQRRDLRRGLEGADLRALRRDRIGFVFQAPYLIPFLDVTDNVALLPMLAGPCPMPRPRRARWNC
jgi:putative ABC transport system ATP-binding protein